MIKTSLFFSASLLLTPFSSATESSAVAESGSEIIQNSVESEWKSVLRSCAAGATTSVLFGFGFGLSSPATGVAVTLGTIPNHRVQKNIKHDIAFLGCGLGMLALKEFLKNDSSSTSQKPPETQPVLAASLKSESPLSEEEKAKLCEDRVERMARFERQLAQENPKVARNLQLAIDRENIARGDERGPVQRIREIFPGRLRLKIL